MSRTAILTSTTVALLLAQAPVARDAIDEEIRLAVGSQDIQGQARTLARLAWSDATESHELAARAREKLTLYGNHGMQSIAESFQWADPTLSSDIMLAIIEAEKQMTSGTSSYTTVALDYAIWFGSPEAKRLAMLYMSERPIPILLLPVMDSAYEYPQLTNVVIDTLQIIRDDRARFFLAEQVQQGGAETRRRAVEAMAVIGGQCFEYLRAWALSEQPELREVALRALLPRTTIGDLTTLYEYVELFPDDDPSLLTALAARAEVLEALFEAQQEMDSASPQLDD